MPYTENQLAEIGIRYNTQRMEEQGGVSVAVARAHEAELGKKFPKARVDELEKHLADVKALRGNQVQAKSEKGTGNVPVNEVIRQCKEWIGDMIAAADNAYEEDPDVRDQFHKAGKIGRSVPKVSGRVQELVALAQNRAADLEAWGFAAEDLAKGATLIADLKSANTNQETAVADLPPKSRQLYVAQGRAYLLLKRLARSGRRVFKSDPTTAAKLNLDILNRQGRRRAPEPATAPTQ